MIAAPLGVAQWSPSHTALVGRVLLSTSAAGSIAEPIYYSVQRCLLRRSLLHAATTSASAAGGLAASSQTIFTGAAVGRLYGQLMHLASPDVATQPCGPPHATKPAGAFDL